MATKEVLVLLSNYDFMMAVTLCLGVTSWMAFQFVYGWDFMLPGDVIPSHYDIQLLYDIDPSTNFNFLGVVDILVKIANTTSKIVLNSKHLHILKEKVKVIVKGPQKRAKGLNVDGIVNQDHEDFNEFLTLQFTNELQINELYLVSIPFHGNLEINYYNGVFIDAAENKKSKTTEYSVVVCFEPMLARMAFPCFDEPMYKATFKLTIGHHKDYHALSNMPIESSSPMSERLYGFQKSWPWDMSQYKDDFVWDQFGVSPRMSTYHLSYVVSKLFFVRSSPTISETNIKIWARPDLMEQTAHAALIAPMVLSYFELWFNISYDLPKLDHVGVHDFAPYGFEGWGLITYDENFLLYDENLSDLPLKRMQMIVISHEVAHQWFGNMVTMKWWNELWLKEGFAEFMADIATTELWPETQDVQIVDALNSVFGMDALKSSRAVTAPMEATSPNHVDEIFDTITYDKGHILVRMLYNVFGEDIFKKAVHKYLSKHSFKCTVENDLWEAFSEASTKENNRLVMPSNVSVARVMSAWTAQAGYPVITVLRDYNSNSLSIYQDHFINEYYAYALRTRRSPKSWWVPLSVLAQRDQQTPSPIMWLAEDEGISHPRRYQHAAGEDEWLLFNVDTIALCRVNYDSRNWDMLIDTLTNGNYTTIPVLNRVQLLSDAFGFAWTGRESYRIALQLASYLDHEEDHRPLSSGLIMLNSIGQLFKRSSEYCIFQKYVRRLIEETYQKVGGLAKKKILRGDDYNSVMMQRITSEYACRMEVPACEEHALEMFQEWMDTPDPDTKNPIPMELREIVYDLGVSRGCAKHWRFMLERIHTMNTENALLAMKALGSTRDVSLIRRTLEMAVTKQPDSLFGDNSETVISNIIDSPVGYYIAKDFIYDESDKILARFPDEPLTFLSNLLNQFTTYHELQEFTRWRDKHAKMLEASTHNIEQGIERAQINLGWLERNRKGIIENLKEFTESTNR